MRRCSWLGVLVLGSLACVPTSRDDDDSAASSSGGTARTLRVYVAGESIERRNRYVAAPFTATGALNERGGGTERNDNDEYGWMVPFRDRLHFRDASLTVQFVGADTWADADDNPYDGTYPSAAAEPTSAISGTSIPSWLEQRRAELQARTFCFDVAFASRGGNDFGNDNDADYTAQLQELLGLLAAGSSCNANPLLVVTGHLPDDQREGTLSDATYVQLQRHRFVDRARDAVQALQTQRPELRLRFVDLYTPFLDNRTTTAFPAETWSTGGIPDFAKITREGDSYHPRRLASVYAGELAADALDLGQLHGL